LAVLVGTAKGVRGVSRVRPVPRRKGYGKKILRMRGLFLVLLPVILVVVTNILILKVRR